MTPNEAEAQCKMLLASLSGEDPIMLKVAGAIPDDRLAWQPEAEKAWKAGDLAYHAATAGSFFLSLVDGDGMPSEAPAAPTTKAALLDGIRAAQSDFSTRVAAYAPEKLAEETDFFGTKCANIELLAWHRDHLIHHRAQVGLYLRLMGAPVPSIYGPSGDENPFEAPEA